MGTDLIYFLGSSFYSFTFPFIYIPLKIVVKIIVNSFNYFTIRNKPFILVVLNFITMSHDPFRIMELMGVSSSDPDTETWVNKK